ncbi:MAG: hypothetical protein ACWA5W_04860 [Phycisphaerales bacterium]
MSNTLRSEYFGPYKFIRELAQSHDAKRFIVLCTRTDTNYLLYRFEPTSNHIERRNKFNHLLKLTTLDHPHLLKLQSVSYDDHGRLCVITPYTGNHDGLVSIEDIVNQRDGSIGVPETARALEHLIGAIKYAHDRDIIQGSIDPNDILIDRYGCLQIQLYGFKPAGDTHTISPTQRSLQITDEIRSIVQVGYFMMTGMRSAANRIPPSRIVKKLDKAWDLWFEIGLDPVDGFECVEHALNALPTNPSSNKWLTRKSNPRPQVHIGSMLRRFRTPTRTH